MGFWKKVGALAAVSFIGATSFAAAADLAGWRGAFKDANIVVTSGTHAGAAQDIAAATNIATALGLERALPGPGEGKSWLVRAAGNDLNYGEDFKDVDSIIDDRDLPTILEDGKYKETEGANNNDVSYTQTLTFVDGTNTILFKAEKDEPKTTTTYLKLAKGVDAYVYELKFDDDVKFDDDSNTKTKEDFALSTLTILGREYTITDATSTPGAGLDSLTLMGGAVEATQGEYTTQTYTVAGKTYKVEVVVIADEAETVKFRIDGYTTKALDEGETDELPDGTIIGVKEVLPNEGAEVAGADIVTFYLGAEKLVLEDGEKINIGDKDIDGSLVTFVTGNDKLSEIQIEYAPKEHTYIAVGENWTDPLFGRFKFELKELEKKTETINLTTGASDGELKLKNNAGDNLEIPFVDNDIHVFIGDEVIGGGTGANEPWTVQEGDGADNTPNGNMLLVSGDAAGDYCAVEDTTTGTTLEDKCDDLLLLVVSAGGEARVIRIDDIDTTADKVDLVDLTTDREWDDKPYGAGVDIDLGFTTIRLAEETGNYDADGDAADIRIRYVKGGFTATDKRFETSLGGEIDINLDVAGGNDVVIELFDGDGTNLGDVELDLEADKDMIILEPNGAVEMYPERKDSDILLGMSTAGGVPYWGEIWRYNSDDDNELTIEYPEEEVVVKAYVTEIVAAVPDVGPGFDFLKDDVDVARLARKPLIAVGGSAINRISAALLGLPEGTYGTDSRWIEATKVDGTTYRGIVRIIDTPKFNETIAMVVAGYEATDTARLGEIIANWTAYPDIFAAGRKEFLLSPAGVPVIAAVA